MGAGQSSDLPYKASVVIAAGKGETGDVRRSSRFKELVPTAFPEVRTLYDAFQ